MHQITVAARNRAGIPARAATTVINGWHRRRSAWTTVPVTIQPMSEVPSRSGLLAVARRLIDADS